MREWPIHCPDCDTHHKVWAWNYNLPLDCPNCHAPNTELDYPSINKAPGLSVDSIPGGLTIKHGICHPDGSPKRYDSHSDIKRALNEAGYTIVGDTPKPYKVSWSGKETGINAPKDS